MPYTIREARISELDAAGELTATVYHDGALAEETYLPRLRDARARHEDPGTVQLVAVAEDGTVVGAVVYTEAGSGFADFAPGGRGGDPDAGHGRGRAGPGRGRGAGAGVRGARRGSGAGRRSCCRRSRS